MATPPEPGVAVLLVEDHHMVAEALAAAFDGVDGIDLVARAASIDAGLVAARRLRPDVVLLDRRLPDGDGIEAVARFRTASPESRMLVLTGDASSEDAARLLELGGSGLLLKSGRLGDLVSAIRTVVTGAFVLEGGLLAGAFASLAGQQTHEPAALTAREREVLVLMGRGAGTDRIAEELLLSPNTVRNHVQRILAKLGAHSKLEAVVLARESGLIE